MPREKDKKECVTVRSEAREDHQPKESKNLFDIFKSRFQGTDTLPNSSVLTAEKNCKLNKNVVELIKSANGLNKKLQSCGKEDHKSVSLDCDRNIWSTLMKDGTF